MHKLQLSLYSLFTLIAFVIIIDFVSPGSIINDEIIEVQRERQDYYNAAKNHHYSYKIITSEHEFLVTEDFAETELVHQKIEYSVSRVFKEINWYKLHSSENKSFYSLRIFSGLVLPLLSILSIFIVLRYKKDIEIFVYILQMLLIGDLIFLIL